MAFVAVATGVGAAVGLSGTAALIGGGALIGAGVGGLYSGITGDGDILNSMLTGGLIGGAGAGLLGAFGVGAGTTAATQTGAAGLSSTATGTGALAPGASTAVQTATPALTASQTAGLTSANVAELNALAANAGVVPELAASLPGQGLLTAPNVINGAGKVASTALTGKEMLGYGLAGTTAMQLLGGKGAQAPASATYPGDIRPYEFSARPVSDTEESQYPTTQYDMAGNPILDTAERSYFKQSFKPLQTYKAGTEKPDPVMAAQGGLMAAYPMEKYGNTIPNTEVYGLGMAEGGEVDMDEKRTKAIMKNIKGASTEQLEKILGSMNQQEFLMKNMPNYAQAMSPSISGMIEGTQYGDRMAQSYGAQPRDVNVMPTNIDAKSGMYGGIASIGRQIDPQTRVNAMANFQRTPYDRNAMESVKRLGVGVDRQLGKDTNLSAFYEQDPMGRDKMGGVRLSQRFAKGGMSDLGSYSDGGRMLKGPGDGVSDDIPAVIGNKQPARLADGEFVIPARIVSELGNGSTDAGAKRLYAMMDRIQAGRKKTVGKGNIAKDSNAKKYLLA
jgi:hypothetical protein